MRSLALLALLVPGAAAAPPAVDIPPEVRPAGQYVLFAPRTDAVSVEYVGLDGVEPLPAALLKDARTFVLDTRGLARGRYRFVAVAAGGTGEQARAAFAVVVGDPGPTPPPGPDDALLSALRVAYAAETSPTKQADVRLLAAALREAAALADDARFGTHRQLNDALAAVTHARVPLPKLRPLREVVRSEFVRQFGEAGDQPLTADLRGRAKALLLRVASLYEEIAR